MKVINAIKFNSQFIKVGKVLDKNRCHLKKLRHQNSVSKYAEKSYSWLRKMDWISTIKHILNPLLMVSWQLCAKKRDVFTKLTE